MPSCTRALLFLVVPARFAISMRASRGVLPGRAVLSPKSRMWCSDTSTKVSTIRRRGVARGTRTRPIGRVSSQTTRPPSWNCLRSAPKNASSKCPSLSKSPLADKSPVAEVRIRRALRSPNARINRPFGRRMASRPPGPRKRPQANNPSRRNASTLGRKRFNSTPRAASPPPRPRARPRATRRRRHWRRLALAAATAHRRRRRSMQRRRRVASGRVFVGLRWRG